MSFKLVVFGAGFFMGFLIWAVVHFTAVERQEFMDICLKKYDEVDCEMSYRTKKRPSTVVMPVIVR